MTEYIDREKLKRDLIDNRNFYPAIVKNAIENAPNEDVVPRSEVELLKANHKKQVDRLIDECGNQSTLWRLHFEKIYQNGKETLKQEVAREIFEEIENFAKEDIRQRQKYIDNFYGKNSKFNDTRSNWLGGKIDGIKELMEECIAELKKKYIGEQ